MTCDRSERAWRCLAAGLGVVAIAVLDPLVAVGLLLAGGLVVLAVAIGRLVAGRDDRLDEFEDEAA